MPDEDFTSIEAALQVVEKFASRLTVVDAEGHVRRSVDELCAAVTKKEGIEPAVDRLLRGLRGLDGGRAARCRRDFGRERSGRVVAVAEARRLSGLTWAARAKPDEVSFGVDAGGKRDDPVHDVFGISSRDWQRFYLCSAKYSARPHVPGNLGATERAPADPSHPFEPYYDRHG